MVVINLVRMHCYKNGTFLASRRSEKTQKVDAYN